MITDPTKVRVLQRPGLHRAVAIAKDGRGLDVAINVGDFLSLRRDGKLDHSKKFKRERRLIASLEHVEAGCETVITVQVM